MTKAESAGRMGNDLAESDPWNKLVAPFKLTDQAHVETEEHHERGPDLPLTGLTA